jgi:two-component system response regulator PilR (NtrC family)
MGFAVSEAGTVAEALRALNDKPAWMLLDLMLPDGSGIDVLRKLQSASSPTRVCVITGCGPEMIDQANQAGAEQTFVKPLDINRLMMLLCSEAQPAS